MASLAWDRPAAETAEPPRAAAVPVAASPAPSPPGWIAAARSSGAFDLPARDLDGQAFSYTVRRHLSGGGRQDVMAWRAPGGSRLTVVVYRPGREDGVALGPEQAVRQLARAAGLELSEAAARGQLATKFGDLSLIEAAETAGAGGRCLAAGDLFPGSGVTLAGVLCSAAAEVLDRRRLACWLDRLTLLSAGGSEAMAAFFARAELQRGDACGEASTRPVAAPGRQSWVTAQDVRQDARKDARQQPRQDSGPQPRLRGRLALR